MSDETPHHGARWWRRHRATTHSTVAYGFSEQQPPFDPMAWGAEMARDPGRYWRERHEWKHRRKRRA